jgi:hypothetical protein
MGIPVSLILIAVGAILTFAVNQDSNSSVDIDVVGWILMAVGLVGFLLSLLSWDRFGPGYWGVHRSGYAYGDGPPPSGRYGRYGRRRTVVEDEAPGAPMPPDAPPPP